MPRRADVFLVRGKRSESPERLNAIAQVLYQRIRPEQGLTQPVVVKVHVGDISRQGEVKTHIRPEWAAAFVCLLRADGISDVVLADSTVNYSGTLRSTVRGHMKVARRHGFTRLGAPFMVADTDGCVLINSARSGLIRIPRLFCRIGDRGGSALVLSHFKGHEIYAFGGTLKNLGMGFVGRQTKADIHHFKAGVDSEKCRGCRKCVKACTHRAIEFDEDEKVAFVNPDICLGCFMCLGSCQHGALSMTMGELEEIKGPRAKEIIGKHITDALILSAKQATNIFQPGHLLYVTDLTRITAYCDCDVGARATLVKRHLPRYLLRQDIGYLASTNPVALDQACVDLVIAQIGEDTWHKRHSAFPFYFPVALHCQTEMAEELGMGTRKYNLIELSI